MCNAIRNKLNADDIKKEVYDGIQDYLKTITSLKKDKLVDELSHIYQEKYILEVIARLKTDGIIYEPKKGYLKII